jgi:hypothetical protein
MAAPTGRRPIAAAGPDHRLQCPNLHREGLGNVPHQAAGNVRILLGVLGLQGQPHRRAGRIEHLQVLRHAPERRGQLIGTGMGVGSQSLAQPAASSVQSALAPRG